MDTNKYIYTGFTSANIIINKSIISISASDKTVVYDGSSKSIIPTVYVNGSQTSSWNTYVTHTYINTSIIDAGEYSIEFTLVDSNNYEFEDDKTYKFSLVIGKLDVYIDLIHNKNYTASLSWDTIKNELLTNIVFKKTSDNSNVTVTDTYSIAGMHNGVYYYGTNISGLELSTPPTSHLVGSTYKVMLNFISKNYNLVSNNYILKYKTAMISSTYYTIEDALAASGSITLIGDSTGTSSYILTSFTALTKEHGSPYSSLSFNLQGRTLKVPYNNGSSDYECVYNNSSTNVYSALYIPTSVSITLKSSANLVVGAILDQCGSVEARGVLMNDGYITVQSGCKVKAYGYIKGNGTIKFEDGAYGLDVFYIADWPGADEAVDLQNNNAFPVQKWRVHNMSCKIDVYNGAILDSMSYVVMMSGVIKEEITDIQIIGSVSSSNCLFKPVTSGDDSHIIKYTTITNDSITLSNQNMSQAEYIEIYGDYIDSSVKVTVKYIITYDIQTSTTMAIPIYNFDITIKDGATLNLTNSSYVFLDSLSKITIEDGATLSVNGSAYLAMMNGGTLVVDGELTGTGTFGGKIETTKTDSIITISKFNPTGIILKTGSTTYTTDNSVNATANIGSDGSYSTGQTFESGKLYISEQATDGKYYFKGSTDCSTYTITYNVNGGDSMASTIIRNFDSTYEIDISMIQDANRLHYNFLGWYIDSSLSTEFNNTTLNNGDTLTLYAKWEVKEYTIQYNAGYGTNSDGTINYVTTDVTFDNKMESFTINNFINDILNITTTASYLVNGENKTFIGWFIGLDSSTNAQITEITLDQFEYYLSNVGIDSSLYLYCEFTDKPKYTITFNSNGGSAISSILEYEGNSIEKPENPTKEGYTFDGWYTTSDLSGAEYQFSTMPNSNITLYAKWNINIYTITFNSMDGSEVQSQQVEHNSTVTKPTDPTKDGNTFDGWYIDESCTTLYDFSTLVTYDMVLYAKWTEDSGGGCVTGDTLITLADGTQKRADQITYDDVLLVWDFYTGQYTVSVPSAIYNYGNKVYTVTNLIFEDGTVVKMIAEHEFFDVEANSFIYISEDNVSEFIGHEFLKVDGNSYKSVKLVGYEYTEEYTGSYTILTAIHYNCITEGMFSLTADPSYKCETFFRIFEVGEGMKFDETKMQAEIDKYGLYTYEDYAQYVSYEEFIAFGGAYFKVLVGKGLLTFEDIIIAVYTYAPVGQNV